jgi:hypothetical protein
VSRRSTSDVTEVMLADELGIAPDEVGLGLGGNWVLRTRLGRLDVMQDVPGAKGYESRRWKDSTTTGQLALAASERRVLVTHNIADFPRILREWAAAQRAHTGVILVYGLDHSEFALVARGIEHWLELRPDEAEWTDFPAILDRAFAGRYDAETPGDTG